MTGVDVPPPSPGTTPDPLLAARAVVVHDLTARGLGTAPLVDVVDAAAAARRWWLEAWPEGGAHVAGQVAQDVQETLLDDHGVRWPSCPRPPGCTAPDTHVLAVLPDLGPDPHWVCESAAADVAPLGALPTTS